MRICLTITASTDFNSRPSARGDNGFQHVCTINVGISIHAPPRGATVLRVSLAFPRIISIHAPPRGATRPLSPSAEHHAAFQFTPLREGRRVNLTRLIPSRLDFNSRPSARGDTLPSLNHAVSLISIHAPPRGATKPFSLLPVSPRYFNSRPSARGDQLAERANVAEIFQFTPLREGRLL